jgi:hypothetical protein
MLGRPAGAVAGRKPLNVQAAETLPGMNTHACHSARGNLHCATGARLKARILLAKPLSPLLYRLSFVASLLAIGVDIGLQGFEVKLPSSHSSSQ